MARLSREAMAAREAEKQAEFDAAVQAKVNEAIPALKQEMLGELAAMLSASRESAGTSDKASSADSHMISELVTHLAKLTNKDMAKIIVSPEEMAKRDSARNEMMRLIIDAHAKGEMPVYRLVRKTYLSEVKIEPQVRNPATKMMEDQLINWNNVPNEAMKPHNEVAAKIYEQFMIYIGGQSLIKNMAPSFVLNGKEIFHIRPVDPAETGYQPLDPRKMGGFAPGVPAFATEQQKDTVRVLGTIAPAAKVS